MVPCLGLTESLWVGMEVSSAWALPSSAAAIAPWFIGSPSGRRGCCHDIVRATEEDSAGIRFKLKLGYWTVGQLISDVTVRSGLDWLDSGASQGAVYQSMQEATVWRFTDKEEPSCITRRKSPGRHLTSPSNCE